MRARSAAASLPFLLLLLVTACGEKEKEKHKPPPPPSSTPAKATATAPVTSSSGPVPKCKIMASEGGLPLGADPTTWLDLPSKGASTVRTVETGRELRFEGPGRARPCADEYAILTAGSAMATPGAGEGPGADSWIATPCGVVRIAGIHKVSVEKNVCRVRSSGGVAYVYPSHDASTATVADAGSPAPPTKAPDGWLRIDPPKTIELRIPVATGPKRLADTMDRCKHAVADASGIAARLADGGATPDLAASSVLSRRAARASCAIAAATAGAAGDAAGENAALTAFAPLR